MKRGIVKLLDVLTDIMLLGMGLGLIYTSLFNESLNTAMYELVGNAPILGAAIGLFFILSVVLRVASGSKGKDRDSFINFHSEEGSVGISTKAICDFIERVGKEFSAIKNIDTKLVERKGSVDVSLGVKVAAGTKIPELSQVLQQRVRESVRESLGLEEINNITIKVREIVGDPSTSATETHAVAE